MAQITPPPQTHNKRVIEVEPMRCCGSLNQEHMQTAQLTRQECQVNQHSTRVCALSSLV